MMLIKLQFVAFYTLIRREIMRMVKLISQTFLPPMITTLLYFIIFGSVVGPRIGLLSGQHYTTFIAPGLVMMAVIVNAYNNVASSLYMVRFQRSIEELLVSPMHWSVLLFGFVFGGIIRGVMIGALVLLVSSFFIALDFAHLPATFGVIFCVSAVFSMAGFLNGILARTFDEIAFVPTFVLTPMIYLGGVFYTANMLPPFWHNLTVINPIYYMIGVLRHTMIKTQEVDLAFALSIIFTLFIALTVVNCICIKKGIGLRD